MTYHIKKDGTPDICRAKPGNCPYGDTSEHFLTKEEAQIHADKLNEAESINIINKNFFKEFQKKLDEDRNKAIEENQDKIIKLKEKLNLEELPEFLIDEIITGSHEYHHKKLINESIKRTHEGLMKSIPKIKRPK